MTRTRGRTEKKVWVHKVVRSRELDGSSLEAFAVAWPPGAAPPPARLSPCTHYKLFCPPKPPVCVGAVCVCVCECVRLHAGLCARVAPTSVTEKLAGVATATRVDALCPWCVWWSTAPMVPGRIGHTRGHILASYFGPLLNRVSALCAMKAAAHPVWGTRGCVLHPIRSGPPRPPPAFFSLFFSRRRTW